MYARPRDEAEGEDRLGTRRALSLTHTMADFGPTSLLRIGETMGTNTGLTALEGFVPNSLLRCHLDNQPSSSGQHKPPNCIPSSPFRRDGSLDSSQVERGAYKCDLSQFALSDLQEQATRLHYLVTFHLTLKARPDPLPSATVCLHCL